MATDDTIAKCILEIMLENEQEEDINIRKVRLGVALDTFVFRQQRVIQSC